MSDVKNRRRIALSYAVAQRKNALTRLKEAVKELPESELRAADCENVVMLAMRLNNEIVHALIARNEYWAAEAEEKRA